jgi:RNA polymerase sigma factor (sigma-70 family)
MSTPDFSDSELIERFTTGERRDAEFAFEALVKRHGPMVLGACRNILGQVHEAEDAFQATFLVLARKAGTVRNHSVLGCWLYEVACRLATRARSRTYGSGFGCEAGDVDVTADWPRDHTTRSELRSVVLAAVAGLPENQRRPVVHRDLRGKGNVEAARPSPCQVGTVESRPCRARHPLRSRPSRRAPGSGLIEGRREFASDLNI